MKHLALQLQLNGPKSSHSPLIDSLQNLVIETKKIGDHILTTITRLDKSEVPDVFTKLNSAFIKAGFEPMGPTEIRDVLDKGLSSSFDVTKDNITIGVELRHTKFGMRSLVAISYKSHEATEKSVDGILSGLQSRTLN